MTPTSLKVGLVCPYSFDTPGGVQNHVLGLARYLRSCGHRPQVLAPGELSGAADRLDPDQFTSAGTAVPVRYNGSVARVNFGPLSAARVRRWLRAGNFDLVHIHEPITPSISLLALWTAERPVVATFHTATPRSRSMQLAGGALRASIEKIGAGIAVSESARDVVVQHLGRDAVVVPNGFTFTDFATGARRMKPAPRRRRAGGPRLVFLGRLDEPRKGLDVLLDAVGLIRNRHPGVQVVVAGEGQRVLPAWCHSLGVISDADKAALLAGADIFVAPHRERESFGIVLLEAMAAGTPVVASDLAPFVDLLGGGAGSAAAGELFASGDPAALAAAVCRVLDRREDTQVERARQAARSFDWSLVGPRIRTVYAAALAVGAPDPAAQRVERAWSALDAALVRRAERAAELATEPHLDPASALLLSVAADAALEPALSPAQRELAESDLSHVLEVLAPPGLAEDQDRASLGRRLYNDAVTTSRAVSQRRTTRILRSAGESQVPRSFEMADPRWPSLAP